MRSKLFILLALTLSCIACENTQVAPTQGRGMDTMPKSKKRGVAFSFTQITDLPLLSPYISWDYNWGNTPTDDAALWFDANDMDFCPMCWNGNYNADKIRAFVAAHPKTKYLLAFNEPNLNDQARMTPAQAAAVWQPVVSLAKELNLKLVSPAMNYGTLDGYSDPVKWLDEFFAQPGVDSNDIYAISVHCYMASPSSLQGYIEKFEKYGKPIWLTEFCAWNPVPGSVETQKDYMCAVLNYLETRPSVERYAWFIPRSGDKVDSPPYMQLLTHAYSAELTELGKMYCYFSPMDTMVWIRANRTIHASEYVRVANNSFSLRPTTDTEAVQKAGRDGLMITNFATGQTLTYQLYLPVATTQFTLRYCGYSNSICEIKVDGESKNFVEMPRNGSSTEWIAATVNVPLKAGCHTVSLQLFTGSCLLSAFQLQ